ncbi:MAG: hypothetical protein A2848_01480 [Candidatus Magasanikbacteria bacterium RIFCSPHIGHO2_01_FULL_50_8]|uniref:Fibronectin type-III domain-containing protein n=2 Tax=Candidatus Magasanikiibacteriota TaxID=1752731 RepID=A0A1F6LRX7_9BACT|nr:MAG: hypothetical protein A2848_01480 [Candidatus Magasanikbacteria bacterium RIFCSPHIGHO2_01_FULL_50_8]OGH67515.1 MAG: hypothetical protein A3C15_03670 [Candidatus Magasanikbacteria bacterium RIFCSPHIGHO2_02_FULL_50_9b]
MDGKPTGDTGYNEWWAATSTHYTAVSDNCNSSDITYVSTTSTNATEVYTNSAFGFPGVPDGAKITTIEIGHCLSFADFGATSTVDIFYRYNSATSTVDTVTPTGFSSPSGFSTSTWSLSDIKSSTSTIDFGFRLASGTKGAKLYATQMLVSYARLTKPAQFTVVNVNSSQNLISWNDTTEAEQNYVIQRSTNNPFSGWSTLATLNANTTSTLDTGLTANTVYCYRVAPKNWAVTGPYSNVGCKATATYAPTSGINLVATSTPGGYVQLTWTDYSDNEDGYVVERSSDNNSWVGLAMLLFNSTKYTDHGVTSGNTYYYRVSNFNDVGFVDDAYDQHTSITLP